MKLRSLRALYSTSVFAIGGLSLMSTLFVVYLGFKKAVSASPEGSSVVVSMYFALPAAAIPLLVGSVFLLRSGEDVEKLFLGLAISALSGTCVFLGTLSLLWLC